MATSSCRTSASSGPLLSLRDRLLPNWYHLRDDEFELRDAVSGSGEAVGELDTGSGVEAGEDGSNLLVPLSGFGVGWLAMAFPRAAASRARKVPSDLNVDAVAPLETELLRSCSEGSDPVRRT